MAAQPPLALVVGNPKPYSRTRTVAIRGARLVADRLGGAGVPVSPCRLVDLAGLAADLVGHGEHPDRLAEAVRTVREPGSLLVVASPTFKAAYSGLLKLFMDRLPRGALAGAVAVPLMTAASPDHRAVVDTYLGPLLVELGATVPVPGLCVLEAEFGELDRVLGAWCADAVPALAAALGAGRLSAPAPA